MSAGTIQLVIALAGTAFLVVVLGAGIVYCVRSAKENGRASRDAGVHAGDYPIPYVIHFHGLAAGLAIVLGVGIILAGGSAGGRGVLIKLRVHFADGSKPIDLNLTYVPPRERAVIVDRLQRKAINATFSPELHALWTGA